jgi:Flagellar basal body-associated protein
MKNKKLLVIILLLVIVAAAAVYFFYFRGKAKTGEKPAETYTYALKDSFVTNVKDSSKLFKATVVLVLDKNGMDDYFKSKEYIVRDTILFLFRDLTEDDITSQDIQDRLRVSITDALNKALGINDIVTVYFSDFVMQ